MRSAGFFGIALCLLFTGCAVQRARVGRWFHFVSYVRSGPVPGARCRRDGKLSYCVDLPPQKAEPDPGALLYVLHPAGVGAESWSRSPTARVLYSRFRKSGIPVPAVVAVSYGPYWTLMDTPGEAQEALFESFVATAMPRIEADIGVPRKRYLWGMSQGGFNGARLIIKRPGLFGGAVLSCPALYTFPLYTGEDDIRRYTERTKADHYSVMWGVNLLRPLIGGPDAWRKENPLAEARSARGIPPTMIQANEKDEFGFYEGGERLARTLTNRGEPALFRSNPGGHCRIDARQAVDFFLSLVEKSR